MGACSICRFVDKMMKPCQIINKPKHPEKEGKQGTKWKDPPHPRRQKKNHLRGLEHQVPKLPLVARSISNDERKGPLERTPTPEEPSLKTPSIYKMCVKLREESFGAPHAMLTNCEFMFWKLSEHFPIFNWHFEEDHSLGYLSVGLLCEPMWIHGLRIHFLRISTNISYFNYC